MFVPWLKHTVHTASTYWGKNRHAAENPDAVVAGWLAGWVADSTRLAAKGLYYYYMYSNEYR